MSAPVPAVRVLRFDTFELDLRAGELHKHGVKLRLQGQPVQLLAILLQSAGNLVTREELRSQLWPADTFVDFDHSLHNAVGRIREVLAIRRRYPVHRNAAAPRIQIHCACRGSPGAPDSGTKWQQNTRRGGSRAPNRAAKQDTCSPGGHAVDSCRYRVSFLAGAGGLASDKCSSPLTFHRGTTTREPIWRSLTGIFRGWHDG